MIKKKVNNQRFFRSNLKLGILNNFLKGIQIGLGFIFIIGLLFGIVWASGWHTADEIYTGIFPGNYKFIGKVEYNGTLNATDATLIGNFGGGIEKSNTSICNSGNEGDMRYNPQTKSYEGCFASMWKTIQNIGCDFEINNNCWIEVWRADSNNLNSNSYIYNNSQAVTQATAFAFAFIDSSDTLSQGYYTDNSDVIISLKAAHPFTYNYVDTTVTMYDINTGAATSSGTFRYGYGSFNNYCTDAWTATWGRFCFTGESNFPFYSGFYSTTSDYCTTSNVVFNTASCSDEKRLIILARVD